MVAKNSTPLSAVGLRLMDAVDRKLYRGTLTRKEILEVLPAHRSADKAIRELVALGILTPRDPLRAKIRGRPVKRFQMHWPGKRFGRVLNEHVEHQLSPRIAILMLKRGLRDGAIQSWYPDPPKNSKIEVPMPLGELDERRRDIMFKPQPFFVTARLWPGRPGIFDPPEKGQRIPKEIRELARLTEEALAQASYGLTWLYLLGYKIPLVVLPFVRPA